MQMASSSLLSLSVLALVLFSMSSLNGIEAQTNKDSATRQTIELGKWGTQMVKPKNEEFDDGVYTGIREINFEYNPSTAIGGFGVTYDLNGEPYKGEWHGSMIRGFTPVKITMDFPNEYITEMSGYTDYVSSHLVVRALTFKTNKRTYGPYGVTSGTPFNVPIKNGIICGFKGSRGYWLDNIGIYVSLN